MCGLENLKVTINIVCVIKCICAFIIVLLGGIVIGDYSYGLAFGNSIIGAASTVIIVGIGSLFSVVPLYFGVKRHNRAVVLFSFFADSVILLTLLSVGTTFYLTSMPQYDKDLQADCLKTTPDTVTESDCRAYYRSDRTAGFRLVWAAYYQDVSTNNQALDDLQTASACCGFFAPFRCLNDTRSFGDFPSLNKVSSIVLKQRMSCGHHASNNPKYDYYLAQENCLEYFDATVIPPIVGGCKYDLGVGSCANDEISIYSQGCASAMEDYMNEKLLPPAVFFLAASGVNMLCMVICTVLFFKRKYEDVFPTYEQDIQYKNVDYPKIKDKFVVKPKANILVKHGFLTPAEMHTRQAAISSSAQSSSVPAGSAAGDGQKSANV